jgi:hypothetical protein
MKNKGRSCAIMHSTKVLILVTSTLFIYTYFICKFVVDFIHQNSISLSKFVGEVKAPFNC